MKKVIVGAAPDNWIEQLEDAGMKPSKKYLDCLIDMCNLKIAKGKCTLSEYVKYLEFLRDTLGEKPTQKQEITGKDGEPLGVQKVFILPNEIQAMDKHIKEVIDE